MYLTTSQTHTSPRPWTSYPINLHSNIKSMSSTRTSRRQVIHTTSMTLTPITKTQFNNLAPTHVNPKQYSAYWGATASEKLQRVLEAGLLSYGGAWMSWFLSFMLGNFIAAIVGTGLIFNWIYTPWVYANNMNRSLRATKQQLKYCIFTGKILSLQKFRQNTGKSLEGFPQKFLSMVIKDENDRELEVITYWQDSYRKLKRNMECSTILVSSNSRYDSFENIKSITEVYVPSCNLWVGDYPYLDQNSFTRFTKHLHILNEGLEESDQIINISEAKELDKYDIN